MIHAVGNVLVFVSTAEVLAFLVLYHLSTGGDWRHSPAGRHLMAYSAAIAAVLVLASARIAVGDSPWFQSLRTVVFAGIPVVFGWRLWLLRSAQTGRGAGAGAVCGSGGGGRRRRPGRQPVPVTGPPALTADHGNTYAGTARLVHDGGTVICQLWDSIVQMYVQVAVRVRGVQAPELTDPGGPQVKAALAELIGPGAAVLVGDVGPYPRPGHITGRLVVAGVDVASWLLERGYAVPWDGRGARPVVPWPPPDRQIGGGG